jgi:hypothetical protein
MTQDSAIHFMAHSINECASLASIPQFEGLAFCFKTMAFGRIHNAVVYVFRARAFSSQVATGWREENA